MFVNNSGKLFSLGSVTNSVNATVSGITGNITLDSAGSVLNNVSTVTNVYKSVMAGNITGVTQLTSIAQKFGFFTGSAKGLSPGALGGKLSYMTRIAGIGKSVGSFIGRSIGKFFG